MIPKPTLAAAELADAALHDPRDEARVLVGAVDGRVYVKTVSAGASVLSCMDPAAAETLARCLLNEAAIARRQAPEN
jgi:hypothetical protein